MSVSEILQNDVNGMERWPLMRSISIPISISLVYLFFIFFIGPKMMKNRKPFNIINAVWIYNLIQILFNFYLCTQGVRYLYYHAKSLHCIRLEQPGTDVYTWVKTMQWLFFINKFLDLLDTVFFSLRKKESHISFLHVYHHLLTFFGSWVTFQYMHGGPIMFFGCLNAFVHTVMYSYYLLSALQINWFIQYLKKPVTQLQIAQFIITSIQGLAFYSDTTCDQRHSKLLAYSGYFGLTQLFLMIILFINFYRKSYVNNKKSKSLINFDVNKNNIKNK